MAGSASRTVTLNVIGNTSGATKALSDVAGHAESSGKRMSGAFSGVLGTLNSTGVLGPFGEAINKITESFDTMGEHGKAAGAKLATIGAAGVGIGGLFTAIGDKDKAASQQLKASVEAIGGSYDEAKEKFEGVIKSNEKFGDSAKTTQDALSILTTGLGSADKATASMADVLNLAAKRHEDLTQAATDWVKINEGKGTKILATLGLAHSDNSKAIKDEAAATKAVEVADTKAADAASKLADLKAIQGAKTKLTVADTIALRNAQNASTDAEDAATAAHKRFDAAQAAARAGTSSLTDAQRVHNVVQGQAAAAADTFTGRLKGLTTTVEDQAASLGAKYGPAVMMASTGISGFGSVIGLFSKAQKTAQAATEAATTATEAGTVATDAAAASEGLALLPILAIVGGLAVVGVAIYELWTHWSTIWGWIKGAAEGVWNWIKSNWPLLLDILLGPIGLAVGGIIQHWSAIKNGFSDVKNWIGDRINDIVDFFVRMPGRISQAVSHAFDGLVNAFKSAVGGMVSSIPGAGIVGDVLGHLPHFAAGGSIYAGQLSVVGENGPELFVPGASGTIIPNNALGGGGGSVNVGSIVIQGGNGDPQAIANAVRAELLRLKRSNVNGGLS